ncbi:hypothetical protein HL653_07095 [Sphingomonas sp. AP4-R1]|uniref:hypothetical protein n=1 Tax=Sphingomonas sp. AP4-R1 TaxID=2735134 RepID=UPI001493B103|nr:hypothetical protein [Sphingomonas sp. AP4-R1]QJU57583.1 hypothetical protein HL653_07095 [Sphingomonas sp. AP4-R1]
MSRPLVRSAKHCEDMRDDPVAFLLSRQARGDVINQRLLAERRDETLERELTAVSNAGRIAHLAKALQSRWDPGRDDGGVDAITRREAGAADRKGWRPATSAGGVG